MKKFKGYDIVDPYPEEGWLKGYFHVEENDIKNGKGASTEGYQDMGYIKHKDYVLHLLNVKRGEKILDVGCSDGAMMIYAGLLGGEVYGVDIFHEGIDKANEYLNKYALKGKAVICDARRISFPDNYFDKVISSDFFEHMNNEDNIQALREIKRVLKPGGSIVIKTPNFRYLQFSRFYKMIKRAICFKNPFDIVIAHTTGEKPQHIGLLTKGKLVKIIKSVGFLNFRFYYDINYKIEKSNYFLGDFFSEMPFLRDVFSEDLIVVIYKPIIVSFFPNEK